MGDLNDTTVRVAARIRPQNAKERIEMSKICTSTDLASKQICLGKEKAFTYDYVFDRNSSQVEIFEELGKTLIDGCMEGYNATLFAYGQTGSGKTYTMGSGFEMGITSDQVGLIPRAVQYLFNSIDQRRASCKAKGVVVPEFNVIAQFLELYNEELNDLLDGTSNKSKKSGIKIHENHEGGIYITGVSTRIVKSLDDTIKCLKDGALCRATASTNMNAQSSRSHAIFTLHIKQQRLVEEPKQEVDENGKEIETQELISELETLTAKFHFVDLAGSERLKRTGATGERAKEGISINCGLLALGNVISALGDRSKRGCHVPYRDSKLTRLLQDSLGGNSRTIMIACVSPSDCDFMETLNTLKYANRARNILNKVVVNQDKTSKQLAALRSQVLALEKELLEYRQGKRVASADGNESFSDISVENSMLQSEADKLRMRLKAQQSVIDSLKSRNAQLVLDCELAKQRVIATEGTRPASADDGGSCPEVDAVAAVVERYTSEIEDLRVRLIEAEAMLSVAQRSTSALGHLGTPRKAASALSTFSSDLISEARSEITAQRNALGLAANRRPKKRPKLRSGSASTTSSTMTTVFVGNHDENKENCVADSEDVEMTSDTEIEADSMDEEDNDEEEEGLDEDEDEDDEDEDEDDEAEAAANKNSELYDDLSALTSEISIKERLVEELESKNKQLLAVREHYESKLTSLMSRIRETEAERDKVLQNMDLSRRSSAALVANRRRLRFTSSPSAATTPVPAGSVETAVDSEVKKVRQEYEKRLSGMQLELRKLEESRKSHNEMLSRQKNRDSELRVLMKELADMKHMKVALMRKVSEESKRARAREIVNSREITQLRKVQREQKNQLKKYEMDTKNRENILRRKQEELELLRKRQAMPLSDAAAGRVTRATAPSYNSTFSGSARALSPPRGGGSTSTSSVAARVSSRRMVSTGSAKAKWSVLERTLNQTISQRQTISHVERDMNNWMAEREKLVRKLEETSGRVDLEYVRQCTQAQLDGVDENIRECQEQVLDLEEAKEEDPQPLLARCTLQEARYLLMRLYEAGIGRGLLAQQKEAEARELQLKMETKVKELEEARHMISIAMQLPYSALCGEDRGAGYQEPNFSDDEMCESTSAPLDRLTYDHTNHYTPLVSAITAADLNDEQRRQQVHKIRRKTATPEELLLGLAAEARGSGASSAGTPLRSVPEVVGLASAWNSSGRMTQSMDESAFLMPPPKSARGRPAQLKSVAPDAHLIGPALRRRAGPLASVGSNPHNNLMTQSLYIPSSNEETLSINPAVTPPGSPPTFRRTNSLRGSGRQQESNVFSRLTSGSNRVSPGPGKGTITALNNNSFLSVSSSCPLECTHIAEGHSKAILDLDVAGYQLLTGSKDRTAKLWDLTRMEEILTLGGHHNNVSKVRIWPEASLLFTVCAYYIKLWDTRSGLCIRTLLSSGLTQEGPPEVSLSMRQNICPPGETNIMDLALACVPKSSSSTSTDLMFLATANSVKLWDLRRFCAVGKLHGNHQAPVMALACEVNIEGDCRIVTGSKDHYMKVFWVPCGSVGLLTPCCDLQPPHYDGIEALALRGQELFSGSRDNGIKKWYLDSASTSSATGSMSVTQSSCVNNAHKDWIQALCLLDDALVSGCRGGVVKVWRADDCNPLGEIQAHASAVNAMGVSALHRRIFTASNDCTVKFWKLNECEVVF